MDNKKNFDIEFRIGTKAVGIEEESGWRNFSLIGVCYEDEIIVSWDYMYPFYKDDNLDDMKGWLSEIEVAMKKPIIDLDNFPNIYENI